MIYTHGFQWLLSFFSSSAVTHPFHCMLIPCLIVLAQAQVNDVMKFKPLYSLDHISRRIHIIIELPLSAGHLYLTPLLFQLVGTGYMWNPVDTFPNRAPSPTYTRTFFYLHFSFFLSHASPIE